jgi:hypothetical protein
VAAFKIGDRVQVVKVDKGSAYLEGMTGTVVAIHSTYQFPIEVMSDDDDEWYTFTEDELAPCS